MLVVYAGPLEAMVRLWDASPMYSYAYTVPPIALYLLWTRRSELRQHGPRPAWTTGSIVLAAALLMLVLGQLAAILVLQQLSFLVALVGLVLVLFGTTHLRIAAPALAYLLFMVPFWDVFTERLHWPFQNNSAWLGVGLLHAVGIPAYREGTVIALSNVTLEVARECSGVNYLIAVLALALPLSFLRLTGWRSRAVLIGTSIGIAALANGLRVALIGTLSYLDIGSPLHGPFHVLHGLFVAGTGYVVLFVGLRILESRQAHDGTGTSPSAVGASSSWSLPTVSGLAVACWLLALVGTAPTAVPVALARPLDRLPSQIGGWTKEIAGPEVANTATGWDKADSQIVRQYRGTDGRLATLQIWYFEAQNQDKEIVNFRTAALYRDAVQREIRTASATPLTVNVTRTDGKVTLFWYEIDGVPEAGQYAAKWKSLWTVVTSRRSNAAAIMLSTPSTAQAVDETVASLQDLATQVHTALAQHWRPELAAYRTNGPGSVDHTN